MKKNPNKKLFQKKKNHNKQHFKSKNYNKQPNYNKKKKRNSYRNSVYYILGEKRPTKPLITASLHRSKKIRAGIFFRMPRLETTVYPFRLNLKLINEYLKKK